MIKNTKGIALGILILLLALFFIMMGTANFLSETDAFLYRETNALLNEVSGQYVSQIRNAFEGQFSIMRSISDIIGKSENFSRSALLDAISSMAKENPFLRMSITNQSGIMYTTDGDILYGMQNEAFISEALKGQTYVSDPRPEYPGGELLILCSMPIYSSKNEIVGVLSCNYPPSYLNSVISDSFLSGNGYFCIVNNDGTIIAKSDNPHFLVTTENIFDFYSNVDFSENLTKDQLVEKLANGEDGYFSFQYNKEYRFAKYEKVGIQDWYCITAANDTSLHSQSNKLRSNALQLLFCCLMGLSIFVIYVISIQRKSLKALQESNHVLETTLSNLDGGIVKHHIDANYTLEYVSDGFLNLVGYTRKDIKSLFQNQGGNLVYAPDFELANSSALEQLRKNPNCFELQFRILTKEGIFRWVMMRTKRLESDLFLGVITDITAMKEVQLELDATISNSSGGLLKVYADRHYTVVNLNDAMAEMTGYTRSEIEDIFENQMANMIHPADLKPHQERVQRQLETSNCGSVEYRLRHKYKGYIWVYGKYTYVDDERGHSFFYCTNVDITDKIESEKRLAFIRESYSKALSTAFDIFFDCDLYANTLSTDKNTWKEYFNTPVPSSFDVLRTYFLSRIHPNDQLQFSAIFDLEAIRKSLEKDEQTFFLEYQIKNSSGKYLWNACTLVPILNEALDIERMICVIKDTTRENARQAKIVRAAQRDGLTSLYNKTTTESLVSSFILLDTALGRSCMIILDIDYFKQVNDNLGHLFGDGVLKDVAYKLNGMFRSSDIVGRIGGDEFMIFLKNYGSSQALQKHLQKINQMVLTTYYADNDAAHLHGYTVSASIGVAIYDLDGDTFDELYKKADIALYSSKSHGRNRYTIYSEELEEKRYLGDIAPPQ